MYLGDFSSTQTVPGEWATYNSSGGSVAASSTGTLTVFEATSTAAAVLGLTDNRSYRGIVGLNNFTIDLTATAFFVPGKDYVVNLSSAIVDGQVVRAHLAQFSIRNRSVRPGSSGAVPANISATSQTFDAIGNRTSVTSVSTVGSVGSVTGAVGSVTGAVGSVTGAVGSVAGRLLPLNASALAIDATGAVAVAAVTGSVGSVDGKRLPANSSDTVISVSGVVDARIAATSQTFDVLGNRTGTVTSVSSAVGSVAGRTLPANSSLGVVSTNGVYNANAVLIGGSSTGIDQINTNLNATVGSRSVLASSDVNLEVVDALTVDSQPEVTGAPAATGTIANTLGYLRSMARNRIEITASDKTFHTDATAVLFRRNLTDTGSTYIEAKGA